VATEVRVYLAILHRWGYTMLVRASADEPWTVPWRALDGASLSHATDAIYETLGLPRRRERSDFYFRQICTDTAAGYLRLSVLYETPTFEREPRIASDVWPDSLSTHLRFPPANIDPLATYLLGLLGRIYVRPSRDLGRHIPFGERP
jgi:hypothetical protein